MIVYTNFARLCQFTDINVSIQLWQVMHIPCRSNFRFCENTICHMTSRGPNEFQRTTVCSMKRH